MLSQPGCEIPNANQIERALCRECLKLARQNKHWRWPIPTRMFDYHILQPVNLLTNALLDFFKRMIDCGLGHTR